MASQLDKKTIETLTKLCRIGCNDKELEAILSDLKKILNYVDQLQEIDTENVEPCNQVLEGVSNVMREDTVGSTLPRETFLANVPSQVGGMVRIPLVLKPNPKSK